MENTRDFYAFEDSIDVVFRNCVSKLYRKNGIFSTFSMRFKVDVLYYVKMMFEYLNIEELNDWFYGEQNGLIPIRNGQQIW